MVVSDQRTVKEYNTKSIFSLINNADGVSRVQLSKKTGLSKATVSTLVEQLIQNKIVYEQGAGRSDTSGRKPILLMTRKNYGMLASISLKQDCFVYSLFDMHCNEIETFTAGISYHRHFMEELLNTVLRRSIRLNHKKLLGFCFAMPATINNASGEVTSSVLALPRQTRVLEQERQVFPGVPVVIGNVSAASAYAEREFGGYRGIDNLIYIMMNDGVGAGIIARGQVFKGSKGYAGEFGHMSIDPNGPLCNCGKHGCIEAVLNRRVLFEQCNCKDYETIGQLLQQKDAAVCACMEQAAGRLGFGISNMIAIFNPEKIVLGGGVEKIGPVFLSMVKRHIQTPCMAETQEGECTASVGVEFTKIRGHAENMGMVKYFLDQIYKVSIPTEDKIYIL